MKAAPGLTSGTSAAATWPASLTAWLRWRARWLLALGVGLYLVLFTAAAWYKYRAYLMGFDLGVHEQVLWNTAHGRIAASSPHGGTSSYFGIDIIVTELLLAPIYALVPSAYTMLLLQTVVLALGALPIYAMATQRLRTPLAGLVFAAAYLLYAPVEWMNLYEFQIRAFATTFLLCALLALSQRRARPFLLWSLLALGCRSDVGLALAGMGALAAIEDWRAGRARLLWPSLPFVLLPIALGLGWLLLCVLVLVPMFRGGGQFLYTNVIYGWLFQHPAQSLATLLADPRGVAWAVLAPRLRYLLEMFLPFAFLPLLAPRKLLPALPIFALNLLSNTPNIHASTHYHYQALIIPFMLVAALDGLEKIAGRVRALRPRVALAALLALALACNLSFGLPRLGFGNPFFTLLTRPIDRARTAAAELLMARIPADAAVAASNSLGAHLARRQTLYVFPGDDVIYPVAYFSRADYLLIDRAQFDPRSNDLAHFAAMRASGRYTLLAEQGTVSLWARAGAQH